MEIVIKKVQYYFFLIYCISALFAWQQGTPRLASAFDGSPTTVGATYYGGEFDEARQSWIVDNTDQCNRIAAGEFTAESLAAIVADVCDDDSGLGYENDTQLHNRVGYAELSNPPGYGDFSALGNLPSGTRLEINYGGKCVIAEKLDVGTGGYGVGAYPRAIDLWWQTARSLGFKSGFDTVVIRQVSSGTPLTPVGQTTACGALPPAPSSSLPNSKKNTGVTNTPQPTSPQATEQSEAETPKDMSSKAFVRLPEGDSVAHGPRGDSGSSWTRILAYVTLVTFTMVELVLLGLILRRKKKGSAKHKKH